MGLFLSPLRHALSGSLRPAVGLLDEVRLRLRVMPWDLDGNLHLNNSRYLFAMDLGRWALVARTRMLGHAVREGWRPTVAGARLRFRRSLQPFEAYDLVTRIVGWTEDDFFIEQRFEVDGQVRAVGHVRGVFLRGGKRMKPAEVLARIGGELESPPLPEHLRLWRESEASLRSAIRPA